MSDTLPTLGQHDAGWIAVNRETGEAVREFFKGSKAVYMVNTTKYRLVPTREYLASLNK